MYFFRGSNSRGIFVRLNEQVSYRIRTVHIIKNIVNNWSAIIYKSGIFLGISYRKMLNKISYFITSYG